MLYMHQNICEDYPTVCKHCNQIVPRREFNEHNVSKCIEFIRKQVDEENLHLKQENEEVKRKLKIFRDQQNLLLRALNMTKPSTFSLFKKDSDIFVSGSLAVVREHKTKRKDRYVML
jgi:1,2-phenylacetyl-CoA epoxidase catalytic subunit